MDCQFEQAEIALAPGDVVVMYTDGISEAMNRSLEDTAPTLLPRPQLCKRNPVLPNLPVFLPVARQWARTTQFVELGTNSPFIEATLSATPLSDRPSTAGAVSRANGFVPENKTLPEMSAMNLFLPVSSGVGS